MKLLAKSGDYIQLRAFALSNVANGLPVDLLHIDIQGGEADFVASTLDDLNSLVRYVVIGTHSLEIEGRLMETFLGAGWRLEMDRPAIIGIVDGNPQISVDGVQAWRNPVL